jgi:hypothetical protein
MFIGNASLLFENPLIGLIQSVEVRFGKEALKTKWVKIAMRKIETLPGGGAPASRDFIGQSPQDLLILANGQEYDMIIAVRTYHIPCICCGI